MSEGFLRPKVGSPSLLRTIRNGMFHNQPLWMRLGGGKSSKMLNRDSDRLLQLEKGGPQAKRGKPI